MKEKNVSNEQLSNFLLNTQRIEHRQQLYRRLAEKILFDGSYCFEDFCFVDSGKTLPSTSDISSSQLVFAQLPELSQALQATICSTTDSKAGPNFFKFIDHFTNPDDKVAPLLAIASCQPSSIFRAEVVSHLSALSKLQAKNEFLILRWYTENPISEPGFYPQRLNYLAPNLDYGEILKNLHLGNTEHDQIGIWIVVNAGSHCPNEMLKYLNWRGEMCIEQTPSTEEIAIKAFANLRPEAYSQFNTELLRKFIKSRNLSAAADVQILSLVCSHLQDQFLLEEYGRLALLCETKHLPQVIDIFKLYGAKWPESQLSCYGKILQKYGYKTNCKQVCQNIVSTLKNLSIYQQESLAQSHIMEHLVNILVSLPQLHNQAVESIITEIVMMPPLLSTNILQFLLNHCPNYLQTGLNRYTSVPNLVKILETLLSLTKSTPAEQTNHLIIHIVKNILTLDSRLVTKLAEMLYQAQLSNLAGLPRNIKKSLAVFENKEREFQEFMQKFA